MDGCSICSVLLVYLLVEARALTTLIGSLVWPYPQKRQNAHTSDRLVEVQRHGHQVDTGAPGVWFSLSLSTSWRRPWHFLGPQRASRVAAGTRFCHTRWPTLSLGLGQRLAKISVLGLGSARRFRLGRLESRCAGRAKSKEPSPEAWLEWMEPPLPLLWSQCGGEAVGRLPVGHTKGGGIGNWDVRILCCFVSSGH